MYDHIINEMTQAVAKALKPLCGKAINKKTTEAINAAIAGCWNNKIAAVWNVHDIDQAVLNLDLAFTVTLTEDEKCEIIGNVLDDYDASIGINWQIIESAVENFIDNKKADNAR